MQIKQTATQEEIAAARQLFIEYAQWLNVDLCFQGFSAELASLPGVYSPPRGRLLIAQSETEHVGCVALRPLGSTACEMKRLFVRPQFRGQGAGRVLVETVIREGKEIGYNLMRLDTLPCMTSALLLYESFGFKPIAPYYETPLQDTVFLELTL